jgi:hypothetical protein
MNAILETATASNKFPIAQVPNINKLNLFLCLVNDVLCHEDVWGSGGTLATFYTSEIDGVG